jgi:hypothetical protein
MLGAGLRVRTDPALRHATRCRVGHYRESAPVRRTKRRSGMVALVVLLLILAIFGGLGFAAHILWLLLIVAVVLWIVGFLIGGVDAGVGRRRWYRW